MEIIVALHQLQKNLNVPKLQENKFGNYKYRSCEDILAAIKPILPEDSILLLNDEIVYIEGRFYVKATASFSMPGEKQITTTGYAREASEKKGMDVAQITGASSSYARKYALNALLAIDDIKDADNTNTHGKEDTKKTAKDSSDTDTKNQMAQTNRLIKLLNSDKTMADLNKRYKDNVLFVKALDAGPNKKVMAAFSARKKVLLAQKATTPPPATPDSVSKTSTPQNKEEIPPPGEDDLPPVFDNTVPPQEKSDAREKVIADAKAFLDSAQKEERPAFMASLKGTMDKMPPGDQSIIRKYYEGLLKK